LRGAAYRVGSRGRRARLRLGTSPAPRIAVGLVARAPTHLWRGGPAGALAESEGLMRARVHLRLAVMLVLLVSGGIPAVSRAADAPSDGLRPGDVVDQQTWQRAEELIPAEAPRHYREGQYNNPIASWPHAGCNWTEGIYEASKA